MTRRYGRAPRGSRCLDSAPHGHWETTTFVGALRHRQLTAPMVTDGPMDGEMFLETHPESLPGNCALQFRLAERQN